SDRPLDRPPAQLDGADVIFFRPLERHCAAANCTQIAHGDSIGPAPNLAICESPGPTRSSFSFATRSGESLRAPVMRRLRRRMIGPNWSTSAWGRGRAKQTHGWNGTHSHNARPGIAVRVLQAGGIDLGHESMPGLRRSG